MAARPPAICTGPAAGPSPDPDRRPDAPLTYMMSLGAQRPAVDCGDWSPGRWWFVGMGGDVNPPCAWAEERDPILFPPLTRGTGFVEFWTRSEKKVRAEWKEVE
jgi:hypothetical protein